VKLSTNAQNIKITHTHTSRSDDDRTSANSQPLKLCPLTFDNQPSTLMHYLITCEMNSPEKVSASLWDIDLLIFFISLKTLDFLSSVFRFQGLVMITKHITSRLPRKSSAHLDVDFAEAHSNTFPEGLNCLRATLLPSPCIRTLDSNSVCLPKI
jgi:hypothetical protein